MVSFGLRLIPALATLLLFASDTFDPARDAMPPTAPRKVRPPGRVLFEDDFSSRALEGWSPDRREVWKVRGGALRAVLPDRKQEHSFIYAGEEDWTNYTLDVDVCGMRGVDKGVAVRVEGESGVGVDLRGPGYQDVLLHRRQWPMGKARVLNANGTWHHLQVEARATRFRVSVDGRLVLERTDPHNARPRGRIGLAAYTGGVGESTVYYDNVVVTALE